MRPPAETLLATALSTAAHHRHLRLTSPPPAATSRRRESHNAAQALRRAADDPAAASDPLALLPAELRLLEHLHEQRCLLLRCVQQLLAIAFVDSASPLHRVASGRVSLLCGEGLPSRLCTLAAAGAFPGGEASAASRLPRRLRGEGKEGGEGDKERLRVARLEWLRRVGAATARHEQDERRELLLLDTPPSPLLDTSSTPPRHLPDTP